MFQAANVWKNQSQWYFCVVKSTFIFTVIYGFLQALKQDNKKNFVQMYNGFHISIVALTLKHRSNRNHNHLPVLLSVFIPPPPKKNTKLNAHKKKYI